MTILDDISRQSISNALKEKVKELKEEPEFQWAGGKIRHAVDKQEEPNVKVAVANVSLDYDLWKGLRNPALIGLHPAGLREIWEFYANSKKDRIDEFGRQTIFQIPYSFNYALKNYNRAMIISAMLPISIEVFRDYNEKIRRRDRSPSYSYTRAAGEVNTLIDRAVTRLGQDLVNHERAVVVMNNATVKKVSTQTIPLTRQGASHGRCKGGNYPQRSIAVLTGLGQFGVSRNVFRDEIVDGRVERSIGPIRSIIIFDKEKLIMDGSKGIFHPTVEWRNFLFKLSDFTCIDPEINKYRFCSYIPYNDEGCGKCITYCPSGAQANSSPTPKGRFPERIARQKHRFWDGKLQFDDGRCCDERGQMATLYPEWVCARCLSICGGEGNKREYAAENFYKKMEELTS